MRLSKADVLGTHLLNTGEDSGRTDRPGTVVQPVPGTDCPTLTEALDTDVKLKGKGRPTGFAIASPRACSYVVKVAGDKPISSYTRKDALALRDWLVSRGLSGSSVTRNFSYVKEVFNFATAELGLDLRNPFKGVYHDRFAGVVKRMPIPIDDIRRVQQECRRLDDAMRWLVALVSDTGMRLAEATGLLKADIVGIDSDMPHVRLIKHPWRNLKTESSERLVPLVGQALWAVQRAVAANPTSQFLFPRYNTGRTTSANSASAALNKWMNPFVPADCTMHSFRHSMRDRRRAVQCPADVIDQIGGWTTDGVGQGYGNGYPLEILHVWMKSEA
jgi:integrase